MEKRIDVLEKNQEVRLLRLFKLIDMVNDMISTHKGNTFMQRQYIHQKNKFVKELNELLLAEYQLEVTAA